MEGNGGNVAWGGVGSVQYGGGQQQQQGHFGFPQQQAAHTAVSQQQHAAAAVAAAMGAYGTSTHQLHQIGTVGGAAGGDSTDTTGGDGGGAGVYPPALSPTLPATGDDAQLAMAMADADQAEKEKEEGTQERNFEITDEIGGGDGEGDPASWWPGDPVDPLSPIGVFRLGLRLVPFSVDLWRVFLEHVVEDFHKKRREMVAVREEGAERDGKGAGGSAISGDEMRRVVEKNRGIVRGIFEEAIEKVGLDFRGSCKSVWEKAIAFERDEENWAEASHLYRRALSTPSKDLQLIWTRFKSFCPEMPDECLDPDRLLSAGTGEKEQFSSVLEQAEIGAQEKYEKDLEMYQKELAFRFYRFGLTFLPLLSGCAVDKEPSVHPSAPGVVAAKRRQAALEEKEKSAAARKGTLDDFAMLKALAAGGPVGSLAVAGAGGKGKGSAEEGEVSEEEEGEILDSEGSEGGMMGAEEIDDVDGGQAGNGQGETEREGGLGAGHRDGSERETGNAQKETELEKEKEEETGDYDDLPRPSPPGPLPVSSLLRTFLLQAREASFKEALSKVTTRIPFEKRIRRPFFHFKPIDSEEIVAWQNYLDYEEYHAAQQQTEARNRVGADEECAAGAGGGQGTGTEAHGKEKEVSEKVMGTEEGQTAAEAAAKRVQNLYRRCAIACNNYLWFWRRYVDYLTKQGKESEALEVISRACEVSLRRSPVLFFLSADLEEQSGSLEVAERRLRSACSLLAEDPDALTSFRFGLHPPPEGKGEVGSASAGEGGKFVSESGECRHMLGSSRLALFLRRRGSERIQEAVDVVLRAHQSLLTSGGEGGFASFLSLIEQARKLQAFDKDAEMDADMLASPSRAVLAKGKSTLFNKPTPSSAAQTPHSAANASSGSAVREPPSKRLKSERATSVRSRRVMTEFGDGQSEGMEVDEEEDEEMGMGEATEGGGGMYSGGGHDGVFSSASTAAVSTPLPSLDMRRRLCFSALTTARFLLDTAEMMETGQPKSEVTSAHNKMQGDAVRVVETAWEIERLMADEETRRQETSQQASVDGGFLVAVVNLIQRHAEGPFASKHQRVKELFQSVLYDAKVEVRGSVGREGLWCEYVNMLERREGDVGTIKKAKEAARFFVEKRKAAAAAEAAAGAAVQREGVGLGMGMGVGGMGMGSLGVGGGMTAGVAAAAAAAGAGVQQHESLGSFGGMGGGFR
uniref:Suppressor of forked domain-containing protein n=1 Tax=Chromera velia CCMP2878 TaxID=1169474 RepID=A0A0G4IDA6_9ALVE|eukprot:Cvel_121.t1-p1 / transcript=Cvel_121.t1 / gene=Cvel_121 / organism=Chromera_velia_CCMP2878 / gene_product=Pre-mRNA-processing factor 39, putative / transcript_product=Pre-mRNA-processing factor 39, putative / location=Cvel_scaffold8:234865-245866(+) / protein_length=1197 / sequence_SO=supercontig / SO=protein_coding / is_pseudo=false